MIKHLFRVNLGRFAPLVLSLSNTDQNQTNPFATLERCIRINTLGCHVYLIQGQIAYIFLFILYIILLKHIIKIIN